MKDGKSYIPVCAEVFPIGIFFFDQRIFPGTPPAFEYFFKIDRGVDIGKPLIVNEFVYVIAFGKAFVQLLLRQLNVTEEMR